MCAKTIDSITVGDIEKHPVWGFTNASDSSCDTEVHPIDTLPCASLAGKCVGTKVVLADGCQVWALLGNIDTTNSRLTEQFLTVSISHDGLWFHLARYHDYNCEENGPLSLAAWLGKDVDQVFPISYDVRAFVVGDSASLAGLIRKEPRERLTRAELVSLAVP